MEAPLNPLLEAPPHAPAPAGLPLPASENSFPGVSFKNGKYRAAGVPGTFPSFMGAVHAARSRPGRQRAIRGTVPKRDTGDGSRRAAHMRTYSAWAREAKAELLGGELSSWAEGKALKEALRERLREQWAARAMGAAAAAAAEAAEEAVEQFGQAGAAAGAAAVAAQQQGSSQAQQHRQGDTARLHSLRAYCAWKVSYLAQLMEQECFKALDRVHRSAKARVELKAAWAVARKEVLR